MIFFASLPKGVFFATWARSMSPVACDNVSIFHTVGYQSAYQVADTVLVLDVGSLCTFACGLSDVGLYGGTETRTCTWRTYQNHAHGLCSRLLGGGILCFQLLDTILKILDLLPQVVDLLVRHGDSGMTGYGRTEASFEVEGMVCERREERMLRNVKVFVAEYLAREQQS